MGSSLTRVLAINHIPALRDKRLACVYHTMVKGRVVIYRSQYSFKGATIKVVLYKGVLGEAILRLWLQYEHGADVYAVCGCQRGVCGRIKRL